MPGGNYSVDLAVTSATTNRQAYLSRDFQGHDFNWTMSWLVIAGNVRVLDDASGCDNLCIRAYEGNQTGGYDLEAVAGGLRVPDV
jgi:hypothetical protein